MEISAEKLTKEVAWRDPTSLLGASAVSKAVDGPGREIRWSDLENQTMMAIITLFP